MINYKEDEGSAVASGGAVNSVSTSGIDSFVPQTVTELEEARNEVQDRIRKRKRRNKLIEAKMRSGEISPKVSIKEALLSIPVDVEETKLQEKDESLVKDYFRYEPQKSYNGSNATYIDIDGKEKKDDVGGQSSYEAKRYEELMKSYKSHLNGVRSAREKEDANADSLGVAARNSRKNVRLDGQVDDFLREFLGDN